MKWSRVSTIVTTYMNYDFNFCLTLGYGVGTWDPISYKMIFLFQIWAQVAQEEFVFAHPLFYRYLEQKFHSPVSTCIDGFMVSTDS